LGCLGEYKDGEFHILAIIFDDVIGWEDREEKIIMRKY
jgi:hypothetical protein